MCNCTGCINQSYTVISSSKSGPSGYSIDIQSAIDRCAQLVKDAERHGQNPLTLKRDLATMSKAVRVANKYAKRETKK